MADRYEQKNDVQRLSRKHIMNIMLGVFLVIVGYSIYREVRHGQLYTAAAYLLLGFTAFMIISGFSKAVGGTSKEKVLRRVLQKAFKKDYMFDLQKHMEIDEIKSLNVFKGADRVIGGNYIKAVRGGITFDRSDILIYDSEGYELFKGFVLTTETFKPAASDIKIYSTDMENIIYDPKDKIEIAEEKFYLQLEAYCEDADVAIKFMTMPIIEDVTDFSSITRDDIALVFRGNKLYAFVNYYNNVFGTKHLKDTDLAESNRVASQIMSTLHLLSCLENTAKIKTNTQKKK